MMLICNEGKDDKKYHIAYQINVGSPVIPYCRMPGHLDVLVQINVDNPKLCTRCKNAAGITALSSVPAPVLALPPPVDRRAITALVNLRAAAAEAKSAEAPWWQKKIAAACAEAGIEDEGTPNVVG